MTRSKEQIWNASLPPKIHSSCSAVQRACTEPRGKCSCVVPQLIHKLKKQKQKRSGKVCRQVFPTVGPQVVVSHNPHGVPKSRPSVEILRSFLSESCIQTLLVWFQKEKAWEQIHWVKIYRNACGVSVCIFWGRPLKSQRECCLLPLSGAASFLRSISWRAFLAEITFHVLYSTRSLVPHLSQAFSSDLSLLASLFFRKKKSFGILNIFLF